MQKSLQIRLYLVFALINWKCTKCEGDENCENTVPQGATFTCEEYAALGLCEHLEEGFCAVSCERCCADKLVPGINSCQIIIDQDLCMSPQIAKGNYCRYTCGMCQTGIEMDWAALESLKEAFAPQLSSWTGNNVCSWNGVSCENGRVVELTLGNQEYSLEVNGIQNILQVVFQIPQILEVSFKKFPCNVIYQLSQLKKLQMHGVRFQGEICADISLLTKLEVLAMGENMFSGNLPVEFSKNKNLKYVLLKQNMMTGSMPVQYSTWKNIIWLDIQQNKISGSFPEQFSEWTNLKDFQVDKNKMLGSLPVEYSMLINLDWFSAVQNGFTGSVPIQYSTMVGTRLMLGEQNGNYLCVLKNSLVLQEHQFGSEGDLGSIPLCGSHNSPPPYTSFQEY
eukprot:TRINITY_DN17917_c0_g1_i1.p1 TRINITY_DN17917_c0_g1~~TRINITY_DN17917_c0_g1_i1.p1  ORF type:complete len:394 (-),score=59.30 TRINITY_DN17917_c0_g1_i1:172-1353(-)